MDGVQSLITAAVWPAEGVTEALRQLDEDVETPADGLAAAHEPLEAHQPSYLGTYTQYMERSAVHDAAHNV